MAELKETASGLDIVVTASVASLGGGLLAKLARPEVAVCTQRKYCRSYRNASLPVEVVSWVAPNRRGYTDTTIADPHVLCVAHFRLGINAAVGLAIPDKRARAARHSSQ